MKFLLNSTIKRLDLFQNMKTSVLLNKLMNIYFHCLLKQYSQMTEYCWPSKIEMMLLIIYIQYFFSFIHHCSHMCMFLIVNTLIY